jgi:hypothetical protein
LEKAHLYDKAIALIDSFQFPAEFDKIERKLHFLRLAGDHAKTIDYCLLMIKEPFEDNWSLYEALLESFSVIFTTINAKE